MRLPFGVVPEDDMFQQKIGKISEEILNIFGIADHILIVGYDADCKDHDRTLRQVMQIYQEENLN